MSEVVLNEGRKKLLEQECQTLSAGIRRRMDDIRTQLDPFAEDLAETPVEQALDHMVELNEKIIALREKKARIAALEKYLGNR